MVCSRKVRRRICCALSAAVLCAAVFFAVSWFATGWSDDGAGEYPGGRIVVDSAGEVLRVSLGRGDADCRPYYEASPQALPVLDEGLKQMAEAKASCEDRMRRWSGITERAQKLAECFTALVADADFMRMVDDFDGRTSEMFKGESIPTLGSWVRIGIRFTAAMRDGSSVPTKYTAELAAIQREIASATAVRNIFRSFVSASDNDYRLRCAPERFRTRVFRDLAQDFSDIVAASATIEIAKLPDTVSGVSNALAAIIDVAMKMQGICRRAKKDMKRLGNLYWSRLDNWDAMRRAI